MPRPLSLAFDRLEPSTPLPTIPPANAMQIRRAIVLVRELSHRPCPHAGDFGVACPVHAPDHQERWCDGCRARAALGAT